MLSCAKFALYLQQRLALFHVCHADAALRLCLPLMRVMKCLCVVKTFIVRIKFLIMDLIPRAGFK